VYFDGGARAARSTACDRGAAAVDRERWQMPQLHPSIRGSLAISAGCASCVRCFPDVFRDVLALTFAATVPMRAARINAQPRW
jgi:hypothetical protein